MKEYFDEATKNLPACGSILANVKVDIITLIFVYVHIVFLVWQLHTVYLRQIPVGGWYHFFHFQWSSTV